MTYLFHPTFKDHEIRFDSEEMSSFDNCIDFNGTFDAICRGLLDFDVDAFHACFTDIDFGLSYATDETAH